MSDLIDRQDAIDAIEKLCGECDSEYCGDCRINYPDKDAKDVLKQLPPAEPKMGWWIDNGDPFMLKCGNCGYSVMRYNCTHFCPNCGVCMRGICQEGT